MKDRQKKRKWNWEKIISLFVLISMVLAIVAIVVIMFLAPSQHSESYPEGRIKSDYVLMLMQCILGVVAMFLPSILSKRWNIVFPSRMMVIYTLFLYAAIFLGEVRAFYYTVPHWDTILHTFSGAMLAILGYSVITLLNNTEKIPMNLSPLFVALFTLCFAVTIGVLWEIYEFTADGIMHTNMQKFGLEDGTPFLGREALSDTMKDLIVDTIGAFVVAVLGYLSLKFKTGWIDRLLLKTRKKHRADCPAAKSETVDDAVCDCGAEQDGGTQE